MVFSSSFSALGRFRFFNYLISNGIVEYFCSHVESFCCISDRRLIVIDFVRFPCFVTFSQEPLGLVSESQCFDKGTIHSRNPECLSRSRVQNFPRLQRLETSSSYFRSEKQGPWGPLLQLASLLN